MSVAIAATRQPVATPQVMIPGTKVQLPVAGEVSMPGLIPSRDQQYIFRPSLVEEVAFAIEARQNCLLVGDAGTGKSSLIEQVASLCQRPLRRVNLHGETDTTLFVGRDVPTEVDGKRTIVFNWGILAVAMREGQWLLLDEIDAALQPVLFVLQSVLEDDGKLLLEDGHGTVVHRHPDFRIFATANTVGIAARNKVLYSGTMSRMNEATLDRFGVVIHVNGLSLEDETKLICAKVPDLDPDFVKGIVMIAHDVRGQLQKEQISATMSTRRCIQLAKAMTVFHPLRAARLTVFNKLGQEDAKVLEGIFQRTFGGEK
jgi:cobaltochelatase CobS